MLEIELKKNGKIERLTNKTFKFDKRIKDGFFTANYFLKVQKIILQNLPDQIVTQQWFCRTDEYKLCGIDEAVALIQEFAINPQDLEILALNDGDIVKAYEPVLKIKGKYENFGFLESVIDATLSRRSSVCTNVWEVLKAAKNKNVFSMADRQDDILTQIGDGYATFIAGINKISTDAQGLWWGGKGMGTMPHALIQMCGGDIVKACKIYIKTFPQEKITALVDYHNDAVNDSLKVAKAIKNKLGAIRIDTSKNLIDKFFDGKKCDFDPHGVCKELVFAVRKNLDENGFKDVKIVVSSSFDAKKIADFEANNTPVDTYGVGTNFVKNLTCGFTADLVELNGKNEAKFGRKNFQNNRLKIVKF